MKIGFVGLGLIIAGASAGVFLVADTADTPVPLKDYAIGIGVGLLGMAQGLSTLLLILANAAPVRKGQARSAPAAARTCPSSLSGSFSF